MDSLSRNGTRCERAYCINPVCVPSRTGMLSGHPPSRFGMQDNNDRKKTHIPDEILPQSMGWLFRTGGSQKK